MLGKTVSIATLVAITAATDVEKNRPVTKVITTLKDMLKQMEKEAEEDEAIFEKMACWCETNDREKTKSIADAEARIKSLTTFVEEATANSARLNTEIKNLEKEVTKNQDALDKATGIRQKELAEFNAEEKDMVQSISALKSAVTVLSKHNSFLQTPASHLQTVQLSLSRVMEQHEDLLKGVLTRSERKAALAFVQAPGFDSEPTFKQNYAPQSGEIFGILRQMKESFEANLAQSQKDESNAQKAYDELKAAKEEEIAAGQAQIDAKTDELANTDEKNAQAKQDIIDTKASLAADEEFLAMLKEKCAMTDGEWEQRQKTRALEMEACSKALAILSGDDAHDLFTRTFNFVQKTSEGASVRRTEASALLSETARKVESPRLAALAVQVKLDAFTKVKKAIDDMVAALMQEKADEIKHKDFCVDEFNKNQLETERKEREKADLIAKSEDLEMQIDGLKKALDTLATEIKESQIQMKRAGEDREKQNKEFQMVVADQRATVALLAKAKASMEEFYGKQALMQEPAGPPPPAGFDEYKKNEQSGGVMGMMQSIIDDAKSMEAEAIRDEEDAQKAYEELVKETNASVEQKQKDSVNKQETKAKCESDLVEAKEGTANALTELEQLSNYNAELHQSCDFVMKNFEIRQTARDEEVEALKQAKAILSGAKFEEFLQSA